MCEISKYKIIETIFDTVFNEFLEKQDKFVFSNIGESKGYRYRGYREACDLRKKVRKCIFPGCSNFCIPKSHTIQKASLEKISELQHLLCPESKEGKIIISSIGINEASTFPGFCQVHENIFKVFEHDNNICTTKDFQLQMFRTICREIVSVQSTIDGLKRALDNYINFRNLQFEKRTKELLGSTLSDCLQRVNINCDNWRIKLGNKKIENYSSHLQYLRKQYKRVYDDIKNETYSKFYISPIELHWVIPVALAGIGKFSMKLHKKYRNVFVFINVIPFDNKTLVIIGGDSRDEKYIERYSSLFYNPLNALNVIERWMVYGSDHWFIKPSIWNSLPDERKNRIIEAISKTDRNIGSDFSISIFDDLRKQFVNIAKQELDYYAENEIFVLNEENKLLS